MQSNWKAQIKESLTVRPIEAYTGNGCNIRPVTGKLYQVDYADAVQKHHPQSGNFGSMAYCDGQDQARALVKEQFPGHRIVERLSMPTLIVEVR